MLRRLGALLIVSVTDQRRSSLHFTLDARHLSCLQRSGGSVIPPLINVHPNLDAEASGAASAVLARSRSDTCARIKNLGFTTSKHIKMYGERFEILSDPFIEGDF